MALIASTSKQSTNGDGFNTATIDTTGVKFIGIVISAYEGLNPALVTDSKGNVYSYGTTIDTGAGVTVKIAYLNNPIVGSGHFWTITNAQTYAFLQVGGFDLPYDFDSESAGYVALASGIFTRDIIPSEDDSLFIAACVMAGGGCDIASIDEGFNLLFHAELAPGASEGGGMAYLEQSVAATVDPTFVFTTGILAGAIGAAFKPSSSPPPPTPTSDLMEQLQVGEVSNLTKNKVYALPTLRCWLFTDAVTPVILISNNIDMVPATTLVLDVNKTASLAADFIQCTSDDISISLKSF